MLQQMHLTTENIINASKKLGALHEKFTERGEKEAIYDFTRMLKQRVSRVKTARGFVAAYNKAVTDIGDKNKVPEAWDKSTEGFIQQVMPFVAKEIFGQNFADEVKSIDGIESR